VTEQNTKKVLAYSTIGSLGLITGCAGSAHRSSSGWRDDRDLPRRRKALLFLVVGTLENRLYTKDMENSTRS